MCSEIDLFEIFGLSVRNPQNRNFISSGKDGIPSRAALPNKVKLWYNGAIRMEPVEKFDPIIEEEFVKMSSTSSFYSKIIG